MTFSEDFVPLTPINFFQISADCHYSPQNLAKSFPVLNKQNYRSFLLPDLSSLCSEDSFAEVAICWHEEGIEVYMRSDSPFVRAQYPEVSRGDSLELFIDTRDVKTSGFNTRFCHQFFFLAEGVEGHFAGELTHFRTEDMHPLCNASDLKVKASTSSSGYTLNVFIPNHCLQNYDPAQFNRLGFSYRINRAEGFAQHFSVVSDDFLVDQQPSLWGSLKLVK